jgi:arsenite-transporting ATPase
MLLKMAHETYQDLDPSQRFLIEEVQHIDRDGDDYVLALRVPFVDKAEVELSRHNDSLYVSIGNYRREISLPRALARRTVMGAKVENGQLRVRFSDEDRPKATPKTNRHGR